MDSELKTKLKALTGKKNVYLVQRCNKAIMNALQNAKLSGRTTLIIQDQGGWTTYRQFGKKLKFNVVELKTDYGLIVPQLLEQELKSHENTVLIIHSIAGYCAEQPVDRIIELCKKYSCLFINDITGPIGIPRICKGDIIVGSFGKGKPVSLGKGGIIASDIILVEKPEEIELSEDETRTLIKKVDDLPKTWEMINRLNKKVKEELKSFKIVHADKFGINVIVKYFSDKERDFIVDYCRANSLEFVMCPKYIRVMCQAVSIEIKRKC